ncbi:unnamed protein product, partial [Mesorhabditis belari]|uniref:Uncharacterized protein n=1 Tax=Mesorhabditis belari TaxID=2138241 RepID=A0AAF3FRA9_9BILA
MLELNKSQAALVSSLFQLCGFFDLAIGFLTAYAIMYKSPKSCQTYKWYLLNNVFTNLVFDVCIAYLSPILITTVFGFYCLSPFPLKPLAAHLMMSTALTSVFAMIISISLLFYYRISLVVPFEIRSFVKWTAILFYATAYSTVCPTYFALLLVSYNSDVTENTQLVISQSQNLTYLQSVDYLRLIYNVSAFYYEMFICWGLCMSTIGVTLLGLLGFYNYKHVFKNANANISTQTKNLQTNIYHVIICECLAFVLAGGAQSFSFVLPTMQKILFPNLDIYLIDVVLKAIDPITSLACLFGCLHTTCNCLIIISLTRHYRSWFLEQVLQIHSQRSNRRLTFVRASINFGSNSVFNKRTSG